MSLSAYYLAHMSTAEIDWAMRWEAEEVPRGVGRLEQAFGHDPELLATNAAFGLVSSLRVSEAALSTGHELHILDVQSQELSTSIMSRMIETESPIGYRVLLESFARKSSHDARPVTSAQMAEWIGEYNRSIIKHRNNQDRMTIAQRHEAVDNFRPMTSHLLYLSECYIDEQLENGLALPCEGGNPNAIDSDLLHDVCDPFYLNFLFDQKAERPSSRSGFNGQVRLRLIAQARSFGIVSPNDTQTQ